MTVSGSGFIVPDVIRDKFIKWETHVPLTYLTNNFLRLPAGSPILLIRFPHCRRRSSYNQVEGPSSIGELDMTFDEWHQTWQRLLKLINQYHPDEFNLWRMLDSSIMLKETRAEDWSLWLSYDTEIRRRSVTTPLDPSQFQKRLFDDLYVRYSSDRILAQVHSAAGPSPPQDAQRSARPTIL